MGKEQLYALLFTTVFIMDGDEPMPEGVHVRLVGKVVENANSNNVATLEAADGVHVSVIRSEEQNNPFETQFVEIIGTVTREGGGPATVTEELNVAFGDDFDMDTYKELLHLSNGQYKSLFMPM